MILKLVLLLFWIWSAFFRWVLFLSRKCNNTFLKQKKNRWKWLLHLVWPQTTIFVFALEWTQGILHPIKKVKIVEWYFLQSETFGKYTRNLSNYKISQTKSEKITKLKRKKKYSNFLFLQNILHKFFVSTGILPKQGSIIRIHKWGFISRNFAPDFFFKYVQQIRWCVCTYC